MKLTTQRLKSLIKQVIKESKMNLIEAVTVGEEDEVMAAVRGKHPDVEVKSLGIMSGENPDGIQASQEENDKRNQDLIDHVNSKGSIAYMIGGVFFKNQERSVLILNPHELASETADDHATVERDAKQALDDLNNSFGQWGYVAGTPNENAPGFELKYEMMAMDKYPGNVYDDKAGAPDEDHEEFEEFHAGEDYMKGQPQSPESHSFSRRDPASKVATQVDDVPDDQEDFYSYVYDPDKPKGIGKKFSVPVYEGKKKRKLRIKRRK
tara:strand:+ start:1828 stop:2625 length:798 start_codon:yes stop_codon:yes gene_type:complete